MKKAPLKTCKVFPLNHPRSSRIIVYVPTYYMHMLIKKTRANIIHQLKASLKREKNIENFFHTPSKNITRSKKKSFKVLTEHFLLLWTIFQTQVFSYKILLQIL
jgi:hypothetical protein